VTLNLGFWFALFVGLAVVTHGQAEEYYIYHDPDGSSLFRIRSRLQVAKS
jgi:hypothetical protein